MKCRSLLARVLCAYKGRRAQQVLGGPLRAAGKTERGWVSEQADGGYILRPATVGRKSTIAWQSPKGYRFEVHGHSFVLLDPKGSRIGEVRLNADGPLRLVHTQTSGDVVLNRGNETVALEASHAVRVDLATKDGLIIDRGVSAPKGNWKVWRGERSLTYRVDSPLTKSGRSKLCVVFSAIGAPYDFTYNYRSSLADVDAYKLYILDNFGSQGSYYFADHRDMSIFDAVQEFLRNAAAELDVALDNISFIGTSKGGTAALAHGLKLGVGRIVVGAPQFLPGTYLKTAAPDVLSFITGDDSQNSVAWLDRMIPSSFGKSGENSSIAVLVGANDSHLKIHVQPLIRWSEQAGLDVMSLVVEDLSHQNIGRAFAPYVASVLGSTDTSEMRTLLPYSLDWCANIALNQVQLKLWVPRHEQVSVVFENEDGTVRFSHSVGGSYFKATIPPGLNVRASVSRKSGDSPRTLTFVTRTLLTRRS